MSSALKELGSTEGGTAPKEASIGSLIPKVPADLPTTVEGLVKENSLLMDILEETRKFINVEESILAKEQKGEKALLLDAVHKAVTDDPHVVRSRRVNR